MSSKKQNPGQPNAKAGAVSPIGGNADPNEIARLVTQALFVMDAQTSGDKNTNYKPLYFGLFNGITSVIQETNTYGQAISALKQLQCAAEDACIRQST